MTRRVASGRSRRVFCIASWIVWSHSLGAPALAADPQKLLREAEELEMAAEPREASEVRRRALDAVLEIPAPERTSPVRLAEAELALRRALDAAQEAGSLAALLPSLERWAVAGASGDENLSALARYVWGQAVLRAGPGGIDGAAKIWEPLGFLSSWSLAGPFDNERGGGFSTAYGPEEDDRTARAAGKLLQPDPERSYPGKVRPVAWRKLPAEPFAGIVDLDALLRPNDEALAYLLTHVESDRAQAAALRIGSDEGFRLWVNGDLVGSRDVHRPLRWDQDALAIRLRKGWNSILVKVSEAKGGWRFRARLTGRDGAMLDGWKEGRAPANAASETPPVDAAEPQALPAGPRDLLRKAIEASGAAIEGPEAYLIGALLLEAHAHDRNEHPDRDFLDRAASAGRKAPARWSYDRARCHVREAENEADLDHNDWREALEVARTADAPSLRASLDLARYYLGSFGNVPRAEGLVEEVLKARPESVEGLILLGEIEERLGFPRGEDRVREGLVRRLAVSVAAPESLTTATPRHIRAAAGYLTRSGRPDDASRLLQRLIERDRLDSEARRVLVELHLARGRPTEALGLLLEAERLDPFDVETRKRRAKVLDGLDRLPEAAEPLEAALKIAPEDHELLRRHGLLLWRLGRRDDAFRLWDLALLIQPNFPELREHLDHVRGKKDEFTERYRRDLTVEIKKALERKTEPPRSPTGGATGSPNAGGGDPVQVLLELTAVRVHVDGTAKRLRQTVRQILNDEGIRLLDRFSTPYSRGEQRVEFKTARVHRKTGGVEDATLRVHGERARDEADWTLASIDLPPATAGEVVEVVHTTEDLRQSFFGDYFGVREVLRDDNPVAERTFILEVPAGRKFHFHQRNLDQKPSVRSDDAASTVVYTWTLRDVPARRPEPGMPPPTEIDPVVEVSTFESWAAFNRWYWNLIHRQLELTPAISAKVAELTSGKTSEAEKIRAVYDFVSAEIRYNAWEFGVHGFKPYNTATVFTRRFGDCKDKANLLCTMLGAAGIRAFPVLIHATDDRWEEDLSIPIIQHFNHCIAHVPGSPERPPLYLDGTATRHAVDELPGMDRGAQVLIVGEGMGQIERVAWNRPEESLMDEELQVSIEPDGSAKLSLRARARGDLAAHVRALFEVPGRRRVELERMLGARFAGAVVEKESFSDLADRSKPVEFEAAFRVPAFTSRAPEGEVVPPIEDFFGIARQIGHLGGLDERRHDLILGSPARSALRAVFHLPPGSRTKSAPADREIAGRFGRLSLKHERGRDGDRATLTVNLLLETTAPRVARADYAEFRRLAAAVARLKDEKMVLEKAR